MSSYINLFKTIQDAEQSCKTRPFDVIIIGSGPAGAQAAIYGASEGLKVGVIESNRIGGQIGQTTILENVMGHPDGITGEQLRRSIKHQILKWNQDLSGPLGYDVSTIIAGTAVTIRHMETKQEVDVIDGEGNLCSLLTKTVVIATGMTWDNADFEHSDMDSHHFHMGPEKIKSHAYYNRKFIVVGGGNSACQAAVAGAEESHVTMIVRSRFNNSAYLTPRIQENNSIKVVMPALIESIEKLGETSGICDYRAHIKRNDNGQSIHCDFNELFYVANSVPNSQFLKGSGIDMTENGHIIVQPNGVSTNLPGIFAIGDIRYGAVRRVATAIGSGSTVVPHIHHFVDHNHICSEEVCF
jgi:thioredoxin reductase (NADPH)